jgi:glycosyltransferase involved in cell wall biosynthesis
VAEEVREWLENNPPERISGPSVSSFHLGADVENSLPSKGIPQNAQSTLAKLDAFPSFLMVGTIEPRKGHAQTLAAFELLWEEGIDINLVIVGKQGWLVDKVVDNIRQHSELNKHLFWLEGISDEYLDKVYSACTCLIAPSKGEGFGLPLIEAAQYGMPIIARDIAVFREVAGEHAFYFTGLAPEKLAVAVTNWLILKTSDAHPSSEKLHFLSWKESALQLKQQIKSFEPAELGLCSNSALPITVESPQKKLYIDISDLVQKDLQTGIQRVTRSILSALQNTPPKGYQIEPVYATPTSSGYFEAKQLILRQEGNISENPADIPIMPQPGDVFLGLDFVARIIISQQQYLKYLHFSGVRIYFVVYDLLPILLPNAFIPEAEAGHRKWLKEISAFDGAICISKAVKADLDTWLSEEAGIQHKYFRTDWFHLGADVKSSIPSMGMPDNAENILSQLALHPSFLMVGTIEPRKGHSQALAAFEKLWSKGSQVELVIVGKAGWMCDDLIKELRQHKELNRHLFWLEGISDEYLEKIYAASSCLLAASKSEGFGLPLIEAAQHSKPIIARDIPVFREVAGDHAFYFNGSSSEDLANAITAWLELFQRGEHPNSQDMHFLTWQESTVQLASRLQLKQSF